MLPVFIGLLVQLGLDWSNPSAWRGRAGPPSDTTQPTQTPPPIVPQVWLVPERPLSDGAVWKRYVLDAASPSTEGGW
jgi:hypothetical protein